MRPPTSGLVPANGDASMWRWWPCFIGGFCGPLLAHGLTDWMAPAVAVGVAFFAMWVVVGVIFTFSPPSAKWSFVRWTAGGALGALIAGVIAVFAHA
jgi:hypothetical protein